MDNKKKFGLVIPKKAETLKMKAKSIFQSDSEEDAPASKRPKIPQKKIDLKSKIKESLEDPSIYEYDSIYDDMKAKQAENITPKEKRNSRYIETLLKAADKRKKENERRVEKKIQVEREKEGDQFKDKDAYVTSSFKKKMQEREEEEERERRETMLNEMMDVTKQKDLSGFYRHFLKQTIGEEKIPIFGEKDVKKEVVSDEEKDISDKCTALAENFEDGSEKSVDTNIDKDSDGIEIDSDSDSTGKDSKKKHLTNESDASSSESSNSNENHNKINKHKKRISSSARSKKLNFEKQTKTYRKSAPSSSESESEEENNVKKTGSSHKGGKLKSRDIQESQKLKGNVPRHDSTDNSELDETLKQDQSPDEKHSEKEQKAKPNIYAKRTVGDAFAEAQARYFQRMAIRNGGIS